MKIRHISPLMAACITLVFTLSARAEHSILDGDDGYRLWLKYHEVSDQTLKKEYLANIKSWHVDDDSPTATVMRTELNFALPRLLGKPIAENKQLSAKQLLIVSSVDSALLAGSDIPERLRELNSEGYVIESTTIKGKRLIVVAGKNPVAALYGMYHTLRLMQTQQHIREVKIVSQPKIQLRVLNHWDNLDRHVERGYAGESLWDWHKLPDYIYQRYHDYARANASIGINGAVLNNVNATPIILTPQYLEKVAALAKVFRPYGVKVYLSINFSSPKLIGGLPTSDPLDKNVQQWWKDKADEIYRYVPDFGGFLVKANSEGQPGPGDFGRTHAQGANMLARALAPHGGVVMWRAFVYANEKHEARSKQAYSEFKPLDGKFDDNVLVQVKNGPIDFQPREPFSPLFGATPKTPLMMEFQITQEYLGFSTHLVYLGPLYKEALDSDTYAKGKGSTVAKVVDGSLFHNKISGIAGVANTGTDRNWTGHPILQANWYVFGRLAWDHDLGADDIADEWIRMTLSNDQQVVDTLKDIMMRSRETAVNYMTPLGLHHMMATGHHYGPGPWVDNLARDDWNPVYYHKAGKDGIGYNRSSSGVNAVEQYHKEVRELFDSPKTVPEKYLLWFHHLPWDYKMPSGKTLWDELVLHYFAGAADVRKMREQWNSLQGKIDPLQFQEVQMSLDIQVKEAEWWRDACVLYFQQYSQMPLPEGLPPIKSKLKDLMAKEFPFAPGRG